MEVVAEDSSRPGLGLNYFRTRAAGTIAPVSTWVGTWKDPTSSGTLCSPARGSGISQRKGNQIEIQDLAIQGHLFYQPTLKADQLDRVEYPVVVRVSLVLDKASHGSQPLSEDVFTTTSANDYIYAPPSLQGQHRYTVWDQFFEISPTVATCHTYETSPGVFIPVILTGGQYIPFNLRLQLEEPLRVRFNQSNTGTMSDILDNSFHVSMNVWTPYSSGSLTHDVDYMYSAVVAYTDK